MRMMALNQAMMNGANPAMLGAGGGGGFAPAMVAGGAGGAGRGFAAPMFPGGGGGGAGFLVGQPFAQQVGPSEPALTHQNPL